MAVIQAKAASLSAARSVSPSGVARARSTQRVGAARFTGPTAPEGYRFAGRLWLFQVAPTGETQPVSPVLDEAVSRGGRLTSAANRCHDGRSSVPREKNAGGGSK